MSQMEITHVLHGPSHESINNSQGDSRALIVYHLLYTRNLIRLDSELDEVENVRNTRCFKETGSKKHVFDLF